MKNQQKLLWIALLVMVVVNLVWLTVQFLPAQSSKKMHPPRSMDFIAQELNLSEEQIIKIMSLRSSHFNQMRELHKQNKELKDRYFALVFEDNEKEVSMILNDMNALNYKIEKLTFDHFKAIKETLTPDQQPKLKSLLHDILRPSGPRHGHHPPPPPHERRHGPPH